MRDPQILPYASLLLESDSTYVSKPSSCFLRCALSPKKIGGFVVVFAVKKLKVFFLFLLTFSEVYSIICLYDMGEMQ